MKIKRDIVAGIIMIIAIIAGVIYSFSKDEAPPLKNEAEATQNNEEKQDDSNILIAYFSNTGNTENMAKEIQTQTGGDIFEISRATDYEDLYTEAKDEIDSGARPVVKEYIYIESYDIIFIGFPIWWDTTPPVINSFLEYYDFTGKKVIPFCTSSSDEITNPLNSVQQSASNAEILEGLRLSSNSATDENGKSKISAWLKSIDIK